MSYGAYIAALEELIQNGETEFQSMNALKDRIEEITGKRPGGSFQRNQADYKRLLSQFTFKSFIEKAPKTDLSKFKLTKSLSKKVKDLNALHKGVYFDVQKTKNGHNYLRLFFNPNINIPNVTGKTSAVIGPPTEQTFRTDSFKPAFTASLVHIKGPIKFTSHVFCTADKSTSNKLPPEGFVPALLIKTSKEPISSTIFLQVSVAAARSSALATKPFNCEFSESTASRFSSFLDVM